ncbi:MAG: SPFH domain-containing protein [Myxococcota bacterium]|nr:SPFH domain-containing protein [Deltaproteobacteria bacterium]MDQ3340202.1 SPFH domain-containing protein [Myxococcota bacterium]
MKGLIRVAKGIVFGAILLWVVPAMCVARVEPSEIGVRQSATSGVLDEDLGPGWHWRVPGIHKLILLPSSYFMLDYTDDEKGPQKGLVIRTKDNNTVELDVTVPIRIKPGGAHTLVAVGNHVKDPDGRFRYQRLAEENATSVLREEMATLDSVGFYSSDRRQAASVKALEALNKQLAPMNLEAQAVLVRGVTFRVEYEKQLQQIQLNEQNKLLDAAAQKLAGEQQKLDNFVQGTSAQVSARQQDWIKRQAELERAYQVGFLDVVDSTPGASRAKLATLPPTEVEAKRAEAAKVFGLDPASVSDGYLIGIKNIQAETLEYKNRITAEADGVQGRLAAEGDAMVARVQGEYEVKLNALLGSPAGRAYVAWRAADNVKFADTLTFSSGEGIPSVLRLRQFAEQFMNGR